MRQKLRDIAAEYGRLAERMADPEVASKPSAFRESAKAHSELSPIVERFRVFERDEQRLDARPPVHELRRHQRSEAESDTCL